MKITNPTKDKLSVQISGVVYEIEPESFITNVPREVAEKWRDSIHSFISVSEDYDASTVSTSVVEEPVEAPKEDEPKEVVVEKKTVKTKK